MAEEVELKFELDSEQSGALRKLAMLAAASFERERQLTLYYDTPKGVIRKHGYSLRVRKAGGGFVQTVKSASAGAGMFARDEWEWTIGSIEPETDKLAATPLGELARAGDLDRLAAVIRSDVRRTSWRVERNGSVIAVDLDEGAMTAGDESARFTELELELVDGSPVDLLEAARAIAERVPLRLGVLTKAERGFALADGSLGKVTKAGPVPVRPDMTVADGLAVVAYSCLKHFRRNEPIVVAERKPEALHQARVAMRRLRSAFSLFRPAAADESYELLRQELKWFTNLLGEARNLDVFLQREDLEERPAELLRRRDQAYDIIVDALQSKRFRSLMFELVAWLAAGRWKSGKKARRPLPPFAAKRLDRLWAKVAGVGDLGSMDDVARHQLRIEVKKLRYGVEFFRGLHPDAAATHRKFAEAIEELQETLGGLNDIATAEALAPQLETVGWGIERAPDREPVDRLVARSELCLERLRQIGRYWSAAS